MKVIESGRPEEAHPSEASPPYAQSEQLRFEVAGEAGSNQAESPQDNGAAPTQPAHPDHDRAPRIEPGSRGTAVGYIRVSTEDQTQGYSLDAQRNQIRRYCEDNRYKLTRIYSDEGVSAHTDKISRRPELQRLLNDAKQRPFDIVVVHTLDRWARNMRVQTEALQILGDARVGFASVTENIDYTTPEGRLMLTMIGGFAEFFSAHLGRHVKKAVLQRAEQGLQNGSVPFGYRTDQETGVPRPVPDETEAIQTVFAKRDAGESLPAIADWLHAQGFRPRGKTERFTEWAVRDMLRSRFYLGVVKLNDAEFPGKHEGIIAGDLFERVKARSVRRGPHQRTRHAPRGVLAGLITCFRCGRRIQSDRNRSGSPIYRERHGTQCESNRRSCVAREIDAQVGDLFHGLVLPPDWREKIARQSVETEGPSIAELQEDRRRLGYSFRKKTMTQEEFDRELQEIDAKLRMAQISTPVEMDDVAELLENLAELWGEATADERRRLLKALVEAVHVDIKSRRIVAIVPVPAFRTLLEAAIERTAGQPAVLISPDEVETLESMELVETGEAATPTLPGTSRPVPAMRSGRPSARGEPIAIAGMACRPPGGENLAAFWRQLHAGKSAVIERPPTPADATTSCCGAAWSSTTRCASSASSAGLTSSTPSSSGSRPSRRRCWTRSSGCCWRRAGTPSRTRGSTRKG